MDRYVVIDLEMCKVPKSSRTEAYRWASEIIQIGAVLLDSNYEVADSYNSYVCPTYGQVDAFIHQLTGIQQKDVKNARSLGAVLEEFLAWLPEGTVKMVSWSESDPKQLQHEMEAKNISEEIFEEIFANWIDCQKMFGEKMDSSRNYSLEEALIAADIYQEGRAHDGLTDAANTALLFAKLMKETKFTLNPHYAAARSEKEEHLSFSLADKLKGFNLS